VIEPTLLDLDEPEPQPLSEPTYFTESQEAKTGRCSYCARPLRGRYSMCSGSLSSVGYTARCDDCVEQQWAWMRHQERSNA
jgi:hypothetical protein